MFCMQDNRDYLIGRQTRPSYFSPTWKAKQVVNLKQSSVADRDKWKSLGSRKRRYVCMRGLSLPPSYNIVQFADGQRTMK